MIGSVLTVCIGNICRSPLAFAVLRDRCPLLRVGSAGIAALVDHPADPHAVSVAQAAGLDLEDHRATQFERNHVDGFDLVLVMTPHERQWIGARYPEALGRTFLLGHWSGGVEVPDPYRRPREAFETAFESIRTLCDDWVQRIG